MPACAICHISSDLRYLLECEQCKEKFCTWCLDLGEIDVELIFYERELVFQCKDCDEEDITITTLKFLGTYQLTEEIIYLEQVIEEERDMRHQDEPIINFLKAQWLNKKVALYNIMKYMSTLCKPSAELVQIDSIASTVMTYFGVPTEE